MNLNKPFEILDCSIRDGGYVNNWDFSQELVRESYKALSKTGVDFVELGFRSSEKYFPKNSTGIWRLTPEDLLRETVGNIQGPAIALMGDYGKIDLEDLPPAEESVARMIRIAAGKNDLAGALDLCEKIKQKGYISSLQCMGYICFTENERKELIKRLADTDIDYAYVGDSYGSIFPFHVRPIFEPLLELKHLKIGFHPHNNTQMAFASTIEALAVGIDIVDSTIFGIGRGAGNLPTEILLGYLRVQGMERYNPSPVLNVIERYFLDIMRKTPWGYQLPYMISGIFNVHPNYPKELMKRQEYRMDEIWNAMSYIRKLNPTGFNPRLVDELIGQGVVGYMGAKHFCVPGEERENCIPAPHPPYQDRHAGKDILILANGPSLKEKQEEIRQFIKLHKPIVLGANNLGGLFVPDYHAFNNAKRFVSHIETVHPDSSLLLGINLPGDLIDDYLDRPYEPLVFNDILDADFDIANGMISSNCRTISVLLAGVAVVMGARRIFIAGMDGYLNSDTTLHYDERFDTHEHALNIERHRWNERFLHQIDAWLTRRQHEGLHIITPTGHSSFYTPITEYL
ncbi:hypothetical protein [Desulfovibrio subterraneus]|jgi:4-hydroxy 2-oxovalerate aldolase|uniref:Pyruvate carboxyltransferase domain-containing protein n=1 Tax=Desulfovibrio subterraneus TaxID=2718620 RepID=A0A7J0BP93_9BACT|nr:hypothetical protein [Desulfovibrio subterraneus]GFM35032.1 hypothetical protein DSM101010T_33970 [Desulfovibrio subterraneus]